MYIFIYQFINQGYSWQTKLDSSPHRLNTLKHYNWTHSTQALKFGDNPQVFGWLRNSYAEFS